MTGQVANDYQKKRYHSDPEYRAAILAKCRQYTAEHKQQRADYQRAYMADPVKRAKMRAYYRAYNQRPYVKVRLAAKQRRRAKERYHTDPAYKAACLTRSHKRKQNDQMRKYQREYKRRRAADPKVRECSRKRSAQNRLRKRLGCVESVARCRAEALKVTYEHVDYEEVIKAASGLCGICHEALEAPIEIDHIIPLSRGGAHTFENLQATHRACNRRKSASVGGRG